jgi:hypothetical protein
MINLLVYKYNLQYIMGKNQLQALDIGEGIVPKFRLGRWGVKTGSEYSLISDRSKYSEILFGFHNSRPFLERHLLIAVLLWSIVLSYLMMLVAYTETCRNIG